MAGVCLILSSLFFSSCTDLDDDFSPVTEESQTISDMKSCSTDPEDPEDPGNTNTGCQ